VAPGQAAGQAEEGKRDWFAWHQLYDDPSSHLAARLALVQGHLRAELARLPAGPVQLISMCAGQGRDVIGVLAGHPRRADVRARLVELDPRNAAAARRAAAAAGLDGVEVVTADAGNTDAYAGAGPARIVVACGIFGNIADGDIASTIAALPGLCAADAVVLWTRHRRPPDLTPAIRGWFAAAGFTQEAFDTPAGASFSVGAHRLTGEPRPFEAARRLFTFTGSARPDPRALAAASGAAAQTAPALAQAPAAVQTAPAAVSPARAATPATPGALPPAHAATPAGKPRARALGIPFDGTPGPRNAITDVPGVEVGYATLIEGDAVRTGVTAVHPRGAAGAADPVIAGFFSQNGNGEMTGVSWIEESGTFAGPVAITNTHAVGVAHAAIIAWAVRHHPRVADAWLLPVAAETWDGYLNDINGHHVTEEVALQALESAAAGPVEEGSVGGGTGMNCYSFKGGSGTASRLVEYQGTSHTVGVLLQANFGSRTELMLAGRPVGRLVTAPNPMADFAIAPPGAGSVIALVATDAPLLPPQCKALARRVTLGLARTGTTGSHFSGDLFLAFSTGNPGAMLPGAAALFGGAEPAADSGYGQLSFIPWGFLDLFFAAVVQATEEAVANALVANEDMTGQHGRLSVALPRDQVAALFAEP
jgi:D-aminopeptidase